MPARSSQSQDSVRSLSRNLGLRSILRLDSPGHYSTQPTKIALQKAILSSADARLLFNFHPDLEATNPSAASEESELVSTSSCCHLSGLVLLRLRNLDPVLRLRSQLCPLPYCCQSTTLFRQLMVYALPYAYLTNCYSLSSLSSR